MLLQIDQPAGVGYSYANVVTGGDYTEAEVAYDLYRFIQAYMQAHPDLQANDFFIVGESCEWRDGLGAMEWRDGTGWAGSWRNG